MKYLGIDYGAKRIGIAISDEEGMLAFPLIVLNNNSLLIKNILNICIENKIEIVILGESNNSIGDQNKIMIEIERFKKTIENESKLPVIYQKEFMTSLHSNTSKLKKIFVAKKKKTEVKNKNDAQAATLILQRYLDKINN